MASTIQVGSLTHPIPSFSRNSTSSSSAGFQFQSTGPSASFGSSATPVSSQILSTPPSKVSRPQMSYFGQTGGSSNGTMMQQNSFNGFNHVNGHSSPSAARPQIYTAIYSGVPVYEMEVNRVAVMRRRSDSWLNATQILKVAGIEKGKRTKVLEKEILTGEHEKVQGGYGKYQGTWINYNRGVEFCRQYGVEELLRPLLEHDMGQDGTSLAGAGGVETPTKEQAMAAQRKRLYNAGVENQRPNGQSPNGTFFKNISATASNAVAAISKARFDSPAPRPGSGHRHPNSARKSSQQNLGSQESAFPGGSQQSMHSLASESSYGMSGQVDPSYGTQNGVYLNGLMDTRNGDAQEPPLKRMRSSAQQDFQMSTHEGIYDLSMREGTPTEPNDSFIYRQHQDNSPQDSSAMALQPMPQPRTQQALEKQRLLTSLFLDPSQTDFSRHPALTRLSGDDLDIPLDNTAHTALHWAATLARLPLLKMLIARGASIYRVNMGGETALIRACVVTNNLDQGSFPELLEMLGPTIEMRDGRGRTVLHHIAVSSAVKGRSAASKYYLESLLEFVVRQGSAPSSQQNSFSSNIAPMAVKTIGLASFMHEIVNARDKSGDTALNIAARIGNRSIIQQLIEVRADATIANRAGLKPSDFGIGVEGETDPSGQFRPISIQEPAEDGAVGRAVGETSREIMTSISALLSQTEKDFRAELRAKQDLIDATHAELRDSATRLADERRRLEALKRDAAERAVIKRKISNLRVAAEEQRFNLAQHGLNSESSTPYHATVGDADRGYEIREENLPALGNQQITQKEYELVNALPPISVLKARATAYENNNANLRDHVARLKGQSLELEANYRKIVSVCTGVQEDHVEGHLEKLIKAIDSEKGEEMDEARVREFLRRVERADEA